MNFSQRYTALVIALLAGCISTHADKRKIDPTLLHRETAAVKEKHADLTTVACHYKT